MSWTFEGVMAQLGDEAQSVGGTIMVHRGRHIVIAEASPDRGFRVTDEGVAILSEKTIPEQKTPTEKPKRAVKSAYKSTSVDDLDLSD